MIEVDFLFDNQLIAAVENLIKNAKKQLILISPFIDLDHRIRDALREKQLKYDFELYVLFGKNEDNYYKSIKRDSLEFLKQFPNIEIRYNDRLHAKFYQNDFHFIMTSLNLYDFSLAKNIEVGIICTHSSKSIFGKIAYSTNTLISQGVDKIKESVLGMDNDLNPIDKFKTIFNASELKYKTRPIVTDKDGIQGVFGGKALNGFDVIVNNFPDDFKYNQSKKTETVLPDQKLEKIVPVETQTKKTLSASQFSKMLGVPQTEIISQMRACGYVDEDNITSLGLSKGLVMKNYMGRDYIAYPEDLPEINKIKNKSF
jgi:hypothetical protein